MKHLVAVLALVGLGVMSSPVGAGRVLEGDLNVQIPGGSAAPPATLHANGLFVGPEDLGNGAARLILPFPNLDAGGYGSGAGTAAARVQMHNVLLYGVDLDSDAILDAAVPQILLMTDPLTAFGSVFGPMPGGSGRASFEPADGTEVGGVLNKLALIAGEAIGLLPEPASLALFGLGLVGLGLAMRRRR